jgi:hypothetical protein
MLFPHHLAGLFLYVLAKVQTVLQEVYQEGDYCLGDGLFIGGPASTGYLAQLLIGPAPITPGLLMAVLWMPLALTHSRATAFRAPDQPRVDIRAAC